MITVGMNYKVLPGKEQIFEKAFRQVLTVMQQGEGHKESFLYKDVNDSGSYLIVSEWFDEKSFGEFIRSEAFAKVTQWGKEKILRERPKHRVYK